MKSRSAFESWTDDRKLDNIGTNYKSNVLPFQDWQKFKEAFAPELISRAISESVLPVKRLLDPFGGSGTSALAGQFLGVVPVTVEVNPYLADVIEAKLWNYEVATLEQDIEAIIVSIGKLLENMTEPSDQGPFANQDSVAFETGGPENGRWLPATFVEPGVNERWLFSRKLFDFIDAILALADAIQSSSNRRLVRVIVGGTLVGLSNARVSGKGRRYRSGWRARETSKVRAGIAIISALRQALTDVKIHNERPCQQYDLRRGDAREALSGIEKVDLAVFSPPYPNSFDYTDVYNIELWTLGYLKNMTENKGLRASTLSSHVQIKRNYARSPAGSKLLNLTIANLEVVRDGLWNRDIPDMVGAYFADMLGVMESVKSVLNRNGEIWMVVGDSRYAGVDVPVGKILEELGVSLGLQLVTTEPFRSMRVSPQQGGALSLSETLLVLRRV